MDLPSDSLNSVEAYSELMISLVEQIHQASPQDRLRLQQYLELLAESDSEDQEIEREEAPYTTRACSAQTLLSALQHLNLDDYCQTLDYLIHAPQFQALSLSMQRAFAGKLTNQISIPSKNKNLQRAARDQLTKAI